MERVWKSWTDDEIAECDDCFEEKKIVTVRDWLLMRFSSTLVFLSLPLLVYLPCFPVDNGNRMFGADWKR